MTIAKRSRSLQRLFICVVLVGASLVLWTTALDPFHLPKLTFALTGLGLALGASIVRIGATRAVTVPPLVVVIVVGMFMAALLWSVTWSDRPALSVIGMHTRPSGLLLYGVCVGLLLITLRAFSARETGWILAALIIGGFGVGAYAIAQRVGIDPLGFTQLLAPASTVGNPNFLSGYAAVSLPAALWGTFFSRWRYPFRIASMAAAGVGVAALVVARAAQGPVAASGGCGLLLLFWLRSREPDVHRATLSAAGAVAVGGLLALVAGVRGRGPLGFLVGAGDIEARFVFWATALRMGIDNPLAGVGLGRFHAYERAYRSLDAALLRRDTLALVESPHNVPVELFATGGPWVALAYLAFLSLVAYVISWGFINLEGDEQLLLGGASAAWFAYQAQSLVSMDVPTLAVTHWVLAAVILVVGRGALGESHTYAWAESRGRASGGRRAKRDHPSAELVSWVAAIAVLGVAILTSVALLRPDLTAGRGEARAEQGDIGTAVQLLGEATREASWEPRYPAVLADRYVEIGDVRSAYITYQEVLKRDPRQFGALLMSARAAWQLGDREAARALYLRALEVEPLHPRVKIEVAEFMSGHGEDEFARRLAIEVLEIAPDDRRALALLEDKPSGDDS